MEGDCPLSSRRWQCHVQEVVWICKHICGPSRSRIETPGQVWSNGSQSGAIHGRSMTRPPCRAHCVQTRRVFWLFWPPERRISLLSAIAAGRDLTIGPAIRMPLRDDPVSLRLVQSLREGNLHLRVKLGWAAGW